MMAEQAQLWRLGATETVDLLRRGEVSPVECVESLEHRCKQVDAKVNALPTRCYERALDAAKKLHSLPVENRGLLCGLPITIKDLTDVANVRTTYGCPIFSDNVPKNSDQLVQKMEQNGGIVFAKSNTPEFGTGGISFNPVFGETLSPRNLNFASGGSSGGAAASLASGCSWLSHGSDMAGSLRTPAAFCGVTSLRPSPGLIRSDSANLPFDVLGAEGPMARTIQDLGLFTDAMVAKSDGVQYRNAATDPVRPLRIAFSSDLDITSVDEQVLPGMQTVVQLLIDAQVEVEHACPALGDVHSVFDDLRAQSYAVNLEALMVQHPGKMKHEIEWNISAGLQLTAENIRRSLRAQGKIIQDAADFMQDYDLLICPATSIAFVTAGLHYPGADSGVPPEDYYRWLAIAYATTVTTLPIITLPVGTGEHGMPQAVQLIGKPFGESALLRHAAYIESLVSWDPTPVEPRLNPA